MKIYTIHTHRFSRLFLALLATSFLMLAGCKDDDEKTPVPGGDENFGQERRIELAADLSSQIPTGEISFNLIYNATTPLTVKATHSVESGKSAFYTDTQLRIGRYVLASVIHKTSENIFSETNVGCVLEVSTRSNAVSPSTFDKLAGSAVLPALVHDNSQTFTRSLEGDGDDLYADAVHERLGDINQQVAQMEHNRKIVLAIANCVLAVAGAVVSGGAAIASVVICNVAVKTVGNMTERMDNCIEISQCCNFGNISAGENGYGIIGLQGDHLRLHNCFSAGAASGYGVGDIALDGLDDVKPRRIVSIGTVNQKPFKMGSPVADQGLFFLVDDKGSFGSRTGYCFAADLANKSTFTDTQSPFDFDDNKSWAFLTPIVPLPYNNMYHSFR